MPDHVLGLKPHTDGSSITFVLQDKEVEGLQVLKDNQWFKVPIIPDALVINLGDQLEVGTTVLYLLLFKIIVVCICEYFSSNLHLLNMCYNIKHL
jgi:hypothetical protein